MHIIHDILFYLLLFFTQWDGKECIQSFRPYYSWQNLYIVSVYYTTLIYSFSLFNTLQLTKIHITSILIKNIWYTLTIQRKKSVEKSSSGVLYLFVHFYLLLWEWSILQQAISRGIAWLLSFASILVPFPMRHWTIGGWPFSHTKIDIYLSLQF